MVRACVIEIAIERRIDDPGLALLHMTVAHRQLPERRVERRLAGEKKIERRHDADPVRPRFAVKERGIFDPRDEFARAAQGLYRWRFARINAKIFKPQPEPRAGFFFKEQRGARFWPPQIDDCPDPAPRPAFKTRGAWLIGSKDAGRDLVRVVEQQTNDRVIVEEKFALRAPSPRGR